MPENPTPTPTETHTPEPWTVHAQGCEPDRPTHERYKANAARIVACVNAMVGIPDPAAAMAKAREALTAVINIHTYGQILPKGFLQARDACEAALSLLGSAVGK